MDVLVCIYTKMDKHMLRSRERGREIERERKREREKNPGDKKRVTQIDAHVNRPTDRQTGT